MRTVRWTAWALVIGLCAACGAGPSSDSGTTPASVAPTVTTAVPERPAAVTIPVATPRKPDVEAGADLGELEAVIADATVAADELDAAVADVDDLLAEIELDG